MPEDALHRLLLDCGFRSLMWTPLRGQRWAVVGELDGGFEITVACTTSGGKSALHVPSETARELLGELLGEMLAQNGAASVSIVVDARPRTAWDTPAWIPLAIGAGAVALFGWIVSTLR